MLKNISFVNILFININYVYNIYSWCPKGPEKVK